MARNAVQCIGILTSGGDCPGLNAAIRGVAKAALKQYGMKVIGIQDGFRGLVENRTVNLDSDEVSGILTHGGTILGTARDKPHKMPMGGRELDMTSTAVENARRLGIDCLVCLGGGGTAKNALHLHKQGGIRVLTLPKTIDNDLVETDVTFGFDTGMNIATEAIDRLHTTASSHQRIIVCEVMGHNAGWLALGSGIAGGADVILIPEIPYDLDVVSRYLLERRQSGKKFSIIAVAEGAISREEAERSARTNASDAVHGKKDKKNKKKQEPAVRAAEDDTAADEALARKHLMVQEPMASRIARQLQQMTGIEARVTSLGHVQRGGTPTPTDRLLCTRLGTRAAELIAEGVFNVMVAVKGDRCEPVPLESVAGRKKLVPLDHPWVTSARLVGTCFGNDW
ncbi:MAG TPA: ATP-dependent 6-phosphofructokinase [Candidatus Ozemobacteraceae bacterium]|nr:ATP-dependent 6-phosphofructokinase [Candidatus Ozemobacteraceae bacterium]